MLHNNSSLWDELWLGTDQEELDSCVSDVFFKIHILYCWFPSLDTSQNYCTYIPNWWLSMIVGSLSVTKMFIIEWQTNLASRLVPPTLMIVARKAMGILKLLSLLRIPTWLNQQWTANIIRPLASPPRCAESSIGVCRWGSNNQQAAHICIRFYQSILASLGLKCPMVTHILTILWNQRLGLTQTRHPNTRTALLLILWQLRLIGSGRRLRTRIEKYSVKFLGLSQQTLLGTGSPMMYVNFI